MVAPMATVPPDPGPDDLTGEPADDEQPASERAMLERVGFFSDGVFAIAATLLVVDLRIPEVAGRLTDTAFIDALLALAPKLYGFAVSIIVIGLYWIGHHRTFGRFVRYDPGLPYLNLPFLICIAFMPFPTAMLGQYSYLTSAVILYAGWQVVAALAYLLLWSWASHGHRLISRKVSDAWIRERTWLGAITGLGFAISAPIAFVSPLLAQIAWWPSIAILTVIVARHFEHSGAPEVA